MKATLPEPLVRPMQQPSSLSDEELLLRYRETGEADLFSELVHRYERELYPYFRRVPGVAGVAGGTSRCHSPGLFPGDEISRGGRRPRHSGGHGEEPNARRGGEVD